MARLAIPLKRVNPIGNFKTLRRQVILDSGLRLPFFLVILITLVVLPVRAERIDFTAQYRDCLDLAQSKPQIGLEKAETWLGLGGGEAADHCLGVALIGLGKYDLAATRLETLAEASRRSPSVRAEMLAQASRAWLLIGNYERAYADDTTALALTPGDVNLLIARAEALAGAMNYWEAIDDLNQALTLAPTRTDALVFRATAYRYVDAQNLAREDVTRALVLAPDDVDALLERGILERLADAPDQARRDWIRILRLAPIGAAADAARRNLEILDIRTSK